MFYCKSPKYKAHRTEVDGIMFDSKKEAKRYQELVLQVKAGMISDLQTQVKYELQPKFDLNKKHYRAIEYVADFVYTDNKTKQKVVEDVKGFKTPEYKLKCKLMAYVYGIEIKET